MSQHDNPPLEPDNLVALLEWLAASRPGDTAYVFLQDADEGALRMTYAELRDAAKRIAVHLLGSGCGQDQPVLLIFNPGLDYICAFFGCLYAGAIPVPAYPPAHARRLERLQAVAVDAGARFALTVSDELSRIAAFETQQGKRLAVECWLAIDRADGNAGDWTDPGLDSSRIAFLQYTSGSTGAPKGVMVTHRNLFANLAAMTAEGKMGRDRGHGLLVAAVSRLRPDRRHSAAAGAGLHGGADAAGGVPVEPLSLAQGDHGLSRHGRRRAQFRLRPLRPLDYAGTAGDAGSEQSARSRQWRRAGAPRHAGKIHRSLRAARIRSCGLVRCLRHGRGHLADCVRLGYPVPGAAQVSAVFAVGLAEGRGGRGRRRARSDHPGQPWQRHHRASAHHCRSRDAAA